MHCVRIFSVLFLAVTALSLMFPSFHLNLNPNIFRSLAISFASSPCRFLSFLPISWSLHSYMQSFMSRVVLMLLTMTAAAVATAIAIATYTTLLCVVQLSMLLAVRAKYLCLSVEFSSISYVCIRILKGYSIRTHTLTCTNAHESGCTRARGSVFTHTHTAKYASTILAHTCARMHMYWAIENDIRRGLLKLIFFCRRRRRRSR